MTVIRKEPQLDHDRIEKGGLDYTLKKDETIIDVALAAYQYPHWEAIFEDPKNDAIRAKRQHPRYLKSGDRLFIPPKPAFKVEGRTCVATELECTEIDLIAVSREWHTAARGLIELCNEPKAVEKASIAQWALEFKRGKHGEHIKEKEAQTYIDERAKLEVECEEAAWLLVTLRTTERFRKQLDALDQEAQAIVYGDLAVDLAFTHEGRKFISTEIESPTSGLFRHLLAGGNITEKIAGKALQVLEAYAPVIPAVKKAKTIQWVKTYWLTAVFRLSGSDVVFYRIRSRTQLHIVSVGEVLLLEPELALTVKQRLNNQIRHYGGRAHTVLGRALATIGLGVSVYEITQKQDAKNMVATANAIVSVLDQYHSLIASSGKWVKQILPRKVVLATVAAVLDIVISLMEAFNAEQFGDHDAALAYTLSAVSVGVMALLPALGVTGAALAWTGIGLVILAIGAGLLAASWTDPPLEVWCKNNEFGSNSVRHVTTGRGSQRKRKPIYGPWRGKTSKQLVELYKMVTTCKLTLSHSTSSVIVTLEPVYMSNTSIVRLSLSMSPSFRWFSRGVGHVTTTVAFCRTHWGSETLVIA